MMRILILAFLLPTLAFGMKGGRRGHGGRNPRGHDSNTQKILAGLCNGSIAEADAREHLEQRKDAMMGMIDQVLQKGETIEDLVLESKNLVEDAKFEFRPVPKKEPVCCHLCDLY